MQGEVERSNLGLCLVAWEVMPEPIDEKGCLRLFSDSFSMLKSSSTAWKIWSPCAVDQKPSCNSLERVLSTRC